MELLSDKRARLSDELRQAFGAWMLASERGADFDAAVAPVDVSGCADAAKAKWFEYLDAKQRLTSAYAEQRVAA